MRLCSWVDMALSSWDSEFFQGGKGSIIFGYFQKRSWENTLVCTRQGFLVGPLGSLWAQQREAGFLPQLINPQTTHGSSFWLDQNSFLKGIRLAPSFGGIKQATKTKGTNAPYPRLIFSSEGKELTIYPCCPHRNIMQCVVLLTGEESENGKGFSHRTA